MTLLFLFGLQNDLLFLFDLSKLPSLDRFELFPFFFHCCFCVRNFHRLRHRDELVHQIVVIHENFPFGCDVVFNALFEQSVPFVALWIHEIPLYERALSLTSCRELEVLLQFPESTNDLDL